MVYCIKFGDYDKNYKYIIFYIIVRLFYEYFLGDVFPDEMKINFLRRENFPNSIIVYDIFQYIFILISGLILSKLEFKSYSFSHYTLNNNPNRVQTGIGFETKLISNKTFENNNNNINSIPKLYYVIIIIYIINNKICDLFYIIGLIGLEFWSIEIIFICIINIILFKIKIYKHQKIAIAIILIFSTLMKIFSIISIFKGEEEKIYKKYFWLSIVGIIAFQIFFFIDAYVFCKIKWYFDLKFISLSKMLIYYGFFGAIFSLIISIITNYIECNNNEISSYFCHVYENDTHKYFDNILIFFKNIWKEERNGIINFGYIIIIFLKLTINAGYHYLLFIIIKYFSPEYLICSDAIFFFITKIVSLIFYIATNSLTIDFIFDTLSQIFAIIGTLIYLELIELNFFDLNYNLKKNIKFRANFEVIELYHIDTAESTDEEE